MVLSHNTLNLDCQEKNADAATSIADAEAGEAGGIDRQRGRGCRGRPAEPAE